VGALLQDRFGYLFGQGAAPVSNAKELPGCVSS